MQNSSEEVSAQRTRGIVRCGEPLVETSRVELLLASSTSKLWQLVVGAVQDVEADVALLAIVATLKITLWISF